MLTLATYISVKLLGYAVFSNADLSVWPYKHSQSCKTDHFHYQFYKAFYFPKAGGTFRQLISDEECESPFLSLKP